MSSRPTIVVFSTGGTIASVRDASGVASPKLTAANLIKAAPQLADIAELRAISFRRVASPELTIVDMIALAAELRRALADGTSGAVVTQGTDTLEETSFVLDLLWERDEPVVFTGAMRHPDLAGADGPANLLAAVAVAASPLACGLGSLVVLNDEIHLPALVRKTHTASPGAFRSPAAGPIGWIIENRVRIALCRAVRHYIFMPRVPASVPPVALFKATLGDDGRLLTAAGSLGYRGLVIEAMGGGHVPHAMVEPLATLAEKMPVVLTSRTGAGEALHNSYGFAGSETDLLKRGLIHGGMLDGPKARLLLTLLLIAGAGLEKTVEAFATIGVPSGRSAFRMS